MLHPDGKNRCFWAKPGSTEYIAYHDHEWGIPVHDDNKWFEMLCLEGAQAGLSWETILKRRAGYRAAFHGFVPEKLVHMTEADVLRLMQDTGIIRNRLKIMSVITNAKAFLAVQEEFGSFDAYIWQFVGGKPLINHWRSREGLPASTPESDAMSKDLKKRGFKFVGSTICYALMQATGMVNDHMVDCFSYAAHPHG
jgi:DNA-3-methyladenine glycosylase I